MLEKKIFRIISYCAVLLSITSIIGNFFCDYPFSINFKWLGLIFVSTISIVFSKNDKFEKWIKLLFFLFVIMIIIPIGWIESGGSSNHTIAFVFLTIICITFLFKGKIRNGLVFLLISVFISMYLLEYYFPNIMFTYDNSSQFLDKLIQIPITLLAAFLLIKLFSNEYENEKNKQKFYASYDELTGLINRRVFDKYLNLALKDEKYDKDRYLVLIDIDFFKKINDTKGHIFGDEILKEFADISKRIIGDKNYIARWGGDEFGILYFGKYEELITELNSIQEKVKNSNSNNKLSFSAGITNIAEDDNVLDILTRADLALYKAKEEGRNCIKSDFREC